MLIFAIFANFAIYVRAYIYKPPLTRGRPFLAIVGWPGLRVPRQWVGDRLMCAPYRAQKCVRGAHIRRVDLAVLGPCCFVCTDLSLFIVLCPWGALFVNNSFPPACGYFWTIFKYVVTFINIYGFTFNV